MLYRWFLMVVGRVWGLWRWNEALFCGVATRYICKSRLGSAHLRRLNALREVLSSWRFSMGFSFWKSFRSSTLICLNYETVKAVDVHLCNHPMQFAHWSGFFLSYRHSVTPFCQAPFAPHTLPNYYYSNHYKLPVQLSIPSSKHWVQSVSWV